MDVSEQVRAAHRELSPAAGRFLDYAVEHLMAVRPLDLHHAESVPEWMRAYTIGLQSWPIFVGVEKLRQISRATVGIMQLIRSMPQRVFGNDARRVTRFYGWESELITALLLEPPNGLDGALARCDFVNGEDGLRCMEVNAGAYLGGWQLRFWERVCRENPAVAPFFAAEGELQPVHRDPWRCAFAHIVGETRRAGITDGGETNVALVTERQLPLTKETWHSLEASYAEVLAGAEPQLGGEILSCVEYEGLLARGNRLWLQERRIHAVVEYGSRLTPQHVYRCFKAGSVGLYNGPLGALLGDKRNLALLSLLEDSDLLSAGERALVHDHVPWSREVADRRTTYRGEPVGLLEFASAHRTSLVLKPAGGHSGEDVHIGSETPAAEWSARLHAAASRPGQILQEYVPSRPYLFQHGAAGGAVQDMVWGFFCFGDSYGGGFVRMLPRDLGPAVINSARGASEACIFEV